LTVKVVVGTQFGDEGKGKIVDLLASEFDVVVRFNGGANAGHTVVVGGEKFAFRLLPSGGVRGKQVGIGNGVVVDPDILLDEIREIEERTGNTVKLWLSDRAHIVMPYHKVLDGAEKALKGGLSSGSTKKGIGPCYGDKVTRVGIRAGDLVDPELLRYKIDTYYPLKKKILEAYGLDIGTTKEELFDWCTEKAQQLGKFIVDTSVEFNRTITEGRDVLLEGAQGSLLDIDHGVYPYGTSSNPTVGGASTGTGIAGTKIDGVVGIVKGYTSRVGEGPFPTEIGGEIEEQIREKGGEYGTVTKRPRRCGWLDLVMVEYSVRINGVTEMVLTKLDVLGGQPEVKVCVAYEHNGEELKYFPANLGVLSNCKPVYETLPGWEDMTKEGWETACQKGFKELPEDLVDYVTYIEKALQTRVSMVSLGQDRSATLRLG
jgi:adenylosuccinate synthase